jgi:ABC-type multidrug transport system fused ATPase/permease subunit
VVEKCQILPDLSILPGREQTEIGERGTNMSGGQKQRINIARALYSDSDIVLIDDALSALDAYVGKKVMDSVFCGEMSNKTRVMVTHHISLLEGNVDKVILLSNGKIIQSGKFEDVKKTKDYQEFASGAGETIEINEEKDLKLEKHASRNSLANDLEIKQILLERQKSSNMAEDQFKQDIIVGVQRNNTRRNLEDDIDDHVSISNPSILNQDMNHSNTLNLDANSRNRSLKKDTENDGKEKAKEKETNNPDLADAGKLMTEETSESGTIGLGFYSYYFSQAGVILCIMMLLLFALSVASKIAGDWWLGIWAIKPYKSFKDGDYVAVFYMLGAGSAVFLILRSIALGMVTQQASVNIFKRILWNILRRPMSFFDTTPSGVIINRCTNDVDQLDYHIPWMAAFFLNTGFNYIGTLILTASVNWIVLVLILGAAYVLSRQFKRYVMTSVELKRIIQLSAAPLLSLSSELIDGVVVVRTYKKKQDMLKKFQVKADVHHNAIFHDE